MGMKEAARKASTVADLFFFIVPFSFFKEVATMTKKYSYKDWAVERFASRRDRSKKKRRHFVDVPPKLGRVSYPGRRHRADKEQKNHNHTGVHHLLVCHVDHPMRALWIVQTSGVEALAGQSVWHRMPYLQNAMTKDAYTIMQRHIHFSDNSARNL